MAFLQGLGFFWRACFRVYTLRVWDSRSFHRNSIPVWGLRCWGGGGTDGLRKSW